MTRTPLSGQKVKGQLAGAGHILTVSRTDCFFSVEFSIYLLRIGAAVGGHTRLLPLSSPLSPSPFPSSHRVLFLALPFPIIQLGNSGALKAVSCRPSFSTSAFIWTANCAWNSTSPRWPQRASTTYAACARFAVASEKRSPPG